MATFVLVHGAWHGGWCWDRVRPLLEADGHRVITPTLTGLSETAHLLDRYVDLSTHIQDVVESIQRQGLQDVVLAGHSYGGQVISGVVRHVRDRLRHVAYLDAVFPMHGESALQVAHNDALKPAAIEKGDGWRIPVPGLVDGELMGVSDSADIEWMLERLTDHLLATFEERVELDPDDPFPIPGSFALCTAPGRENSGPAQNARRVRALGWPVTEVATGHDLMITEPEQTAKFLLAGAG